MKPHITVGPSPDVADLYARKCISVVDLTADPSYRGLWRSNRPGAARDAGSTPGAPTEPGFASSMGYWLSSPGLPAASSAGGLTITFAAQGEDAGSPPDHPARPPLGVEPRPVQTVRVKSPNSGDGDVMLTVGPGGAHVVSTPAAWKALAEPVLLALCQYWRFSVIDAEIARLTEHAHGDLDHANMPGVSTLRAHRRVVQSARDVRALMLDLPHFEGPLTDPFPFCSSERSAQVYESLAEKLRLEEWCELIDERAEAVEDTYEALTEKLFEYKNFAWEALLEVLIVVILLTELSLALYEAFAP